MGGLDAWIGPVVVKPKTKPQQETLIVQEVCSKCKKPIPLNVPVYRLMVNYQWLKPLACSCHPLSPWGKLHLDATFGWLTLTGRGLVEDLQHMVCLTQPASNRKLTPYSPAPRDASCRRKRCGNRLSPLRECLTTKHVTLTQLKTLFQLAFIPRLKPVGIPARTVIKGKTDVYCIACKNKIFDPMRPKEEKEEQQ